MKTNCTPLAIGFAVALLAVAPQLSYAVVGYYNVSMPGGGWKLIANQLNAANNNANFALVSSVPDGTCLYRYDPVNQDFYDGATYYTNRVGWWPVSGNTNDVALTLTVGEGFFVWSPRAWTATFVGEVMEGNLTNPIPKFYSLKASMVPQNGRLSSDLAFPAAANDQIFKWATNAYSTYLFDAGLWTPSEPLVDVGEGFMVYAPNAQLWVRNFTVQAPAPSLVRSKSPSLTTTGSVGAKIRSISLKDGLIILEINNPSGTAYNVQFSSDSVSWKDVATGLTGAAWQQPAPGGEAGYYQLVNP